MAEGGKRAQFSAGKGRIHEEGVLDELALTGELLRLEGASARMLMRTAPRAARWMMWIM